MPTIHRMCAHCTDFLLGDWLIVMYMYDFVHPRILDSAVRRRIGLLTAHEQRMIIRGHYQHALSHVLVNEGFRNFKASLFK